MIPLAFLEVLPLPLLPTLLPPRKHPPITPTLLPLKTSFPLIPNLPLVTNFLRCSFLLATPTPQTTSAPAVNNTRPPSTKPLTPEEQQKENERRAEIIDEIAKKVDAWAGSRKGNLRSLLSTLHQALWEVLVLLSILYLRRELLGNHLAWEI